MFLHLEPSRPPSDVMVTSSTPDVSLESPNNIFDAGNQMLNQSLKNTSTCSSQQTSQFWLL